MPGDSVNRFRFKACSKCRGDLVLDEGDWLCLQCGTYYYTDLYRETRMARKPRPAPEPPHEEKTLLPGRTAAGCPAHTGAAVVPVDRPKTAFVISRQALSLARPPGPGPMAFGR